MTHTEKSTDPKDPWPERTRVVKDNRVRSIYYQLWITCKGFLLTRYSCHYRCINFFGVLLIDLEPVKPGIKASLRPPYDKFPDYRLPPQVNSDEDDTFIPVDYADSSYKGRRRFGSQDHQHDLDNFADANNNPPDIKPEVAAKLNFDVQPSPSASISPINYQGFPPSSFPNNDGRRRNEPGFVTEEPGAFPLLGPFQIVKDQGQSGSANPTYDSDLRYGLRYGTVKFFDDAARACIRDGNPDPSPLDVYTKLREFLESIIKTCRDRISQYDFEDGHLINAFVNLEKLLQDLRCYSPQCRPNAERLRTIFEEMKIALQPRLGIHRWDLQRKRELDFITWLEEIRNYAAAHMIEDQQAREREMARSFTDSVAVGGPRAPGVEGSADEGRSGVGKGDAARVKGTGRGRGRSGEVRRQP